MIDKGGLKLETFDLGSCCICELRTDVNNVLHLNFKIESESRWGCFECDLPIEGAVACFCDACVESYGLDTVESHLRFLMNGTEKRIPMPPPEKRPPHEHDLRYHFSEGANTCHKR